MGAIHHESSTSLCSTLVSDSAAHSFAALQVSTAMAKGRTRTNHEYYDSQAGQGPSPAVALMLVQSSRAARSGALPSDQPGSGISVSILSVRGRSRCAACVLHLTLVLSGPSSGVVQTVPYPDMGRRRCAARRGKFGIERHAKEPQHVCSDPSRREQDLEEKKAPRTLHRLCFANTGPGTRKSGVAGLGSFPKIWISSQG